MAAAKRDNARRNYWAARRLARRRQPAIRTRPRVLALAVGAALLPWAPAAYSLPTGEQTLFGKVEYSRSTSTSMNIDVKTQTAGSSFLNFSVQRGESVNIQQLSANSTYLIKDIGGKPSDIFGSVTANGQIFLSNTSGVIFGPNASVNVGGLFATSLTIKDQDFMAGRYLWFNPGDSKGVETQRDGEQRAVINATSYAVLAGPQVKNDGLIVAHAGTVALAAGNRVTLDMVGDGLIKVNVDEAALNASAINSGRIEADGGNVLLTARSANALLDTVVNNSGVIRANSLVERNGEIVLDGGSAGVVSNTGTLQAAGTEAGTVGGTGKVLGQYVGLFDGSKIDVSGDAGGGDVAVGGDFHGAGPDQNASRTHVSGGASINADAVNSGDGGRVVVWSDNGTTFYGSISARGGARSGNGGIVEVSGKHSLTYAGMTDLRAANGAVGALLLDPDEITITHDTAANTTGISCADTGGGTGTCADPDVNADAAGPFNDTTATTGVLTDGTLNAQLGFANVTVTTSTDGITANNDVVINASANTLALNSATYITLGGTYDAPLSLAFQTTLDLTNNPALNAGATALGAGTSSVIKGSGRTYVLTDGTPDAGITGTVSWTNVGTIDDSTGTVDFSTSGSLTGDVNADTLNYTAYGLGLTLDISAGTLVNSGVGGTLTFNKVNANAGQTNTVTGTGASYTLDDVVQDKGTGGGYTWTAFQNIDDGTGTVSFGTGGSVSGDVNADTLNYTAYGLGLTLDISAGTLANSGVGGTLAFSNVNANAGQTNTVTGTGAIYALDNAVQDKGTGGGYTWTAFQNIDDGTGTVGFGTGGSVSGDVSAGRLDFTSYGSGVTLDITNQTVTGVGGTAIAANVDANGLQSNTVTGSGANYTLDNAVQDKGTGGGYTWTAFQNINDGTGTVSFGTAGSVSGDVSADTLNYTAYGLGLTLDISAGTLANSGVGGTLAFNKVNANAGQTNTVTGTGASYALDNAVQDKGTGGGYTWTAFQNIDDGTGTVGFGTGGSVSGSVSAHTLDYGAYGTAIAFDLSDGSGATTGVGTTWSGVVTITGSAGSDTIQGTNKTYNLTGANQGNSGAISWTSFENLRDTGSGIFKMHSGADGSISGALDGGTSGSMDYTGYTSAATFSLSGAAGSTTGVGGTRTGIASVIGTGASDVITGSGATYDLTSQDAGKSGSVSWTAFENISDSSGGLFKLFVASNNVTGTISSGGAGPASCAALNPATCANLNSNIDITSLNVSVGGTLLMTGNASSWNLTGAPQPASFGASNPNANVFFNGACVGGPACGTVITITGSIGATVSQIATQALQEALDTDSVQKQIDYGFAGDVGTTPPMDHRIDETGISTPACFNESREGEACKD